MNLYERIRVNSHTSDALITFESRGKSVVKLTYPEFFDTIDKTSESMRASLRAGRPQVLIQCAEPFDFVRTFWATISMEGTAVIAPVIENQQHEQLIPQIIGQLGDLIAIGNANTLTKLGGNGQSTHEIDDRLRALEVSSNQSSTKEPLSDVIQFSSGSTGLPKGVRLSSESLLGSAESVAERLSLTAADATYSWLPMSHNFALFGFHLTATMAGIAQTIARPVDFMINPVSWITSMSMCSATISGAPNFAFRMLLRAIEHTPESRLTKVPWDLTNLRLMVSGGEPIEPETVAQFEDILSKYGAKRNLVAPSYGMSETTVGISIGVRERELTYVELDRSSLSVGDKIQPATGESKASQAVSLGKPLTGVLARVVDGDDRVVGDEVVGHVQVIGTGLMKGYVDKAESNEAFTKDGWLRTGDIGFIRNGEIYLTGREKAMIVVNGKNYYAEDLEQVIAKVYPELAEHIAVTSEHDPSSGTERIVVIAEKAETSSGSQRCRRWSDLKRQFVEDTHLRIDQIVEVEKLPRGVSGKIRRLDLSAIIVNAKGD